MSVKDDLLRTEAYPAPLPSAVEFIETHISWVYLLDGDVYKLKKPVSLGFLDFSTIEKRRAACEAEVRLNARLSPSVYCGVVPVGRSEDQRCSIGGTGPTVDWAVHMVRLEEARRADQLLLRGQLTTDAIDAIAKRLAQFHATARCDAETARFGLPEAIAINIEENFAQTRDVIADYVSPKDADEIVRWQSSFLREHAALFEQRIAAKRVRDGHGDLRLEHIYLDRIEAPIIIDCIEFNDRFRFADVCADIAFLSMDLAAHGRVDLSERLLAQYAREANDFDLYSVVDFYESYRAFVRGKISAMVAADDGLDATLRARAALEARRYFLLALSADRRSLLQPALVAVGGIIASGKSTIADRIGAAMGAPVIDADRTRKAMIGVEPTRPMHDAAWQGAYDPVFTEQVYAEVLRRAEVVLASGRPVVVDASFRSRAMRAAAREMACAHKVHFRLVECHAALSLCRERLIAREQEVAVSDGRGEIFDDFCARFEPVLELPTTEHIVLDTTRAIEQAVGALYAHLDTWPLGFVA